MRSRFVLPGLLLFAGCQICCRPVQAGLYNTEDPGPPWSSRIAADEPPVWPTANLEQFSYVVKQLREVAKAQTSLRKLYDQRIAELETKNRAGGLSVEDRVNLSAYYLRLKQPEKALPLLEPVQNQANFMVLSNLAMAHEQSERLDTAIRFVERALAAWPTIWPGLTRQELNWLYRVEKYHLTLLRLRLAEQSRPAGKPPETLDALFPVRFKRADGTYQVNELESAQFAELPEEALLVVQHLLLWNPSDLRLYWLLGELLNARGNFLATCDLFKLLVFDEGYGSKELREHRVILNAARDAITRVSRESGALSVLLWGMTPRGATLEPGIAALANEAGPFGRVEYHRKLTQSGPTVIHGCRPSARRHSSKQGKGLLSGSARGGQLPSWLSGHAADRLSVSRIASTISNTPLPLKVSVKSAKRKRLTQLLDHRRGS